MFLSAYPSPAGHFPVPFAFFAVPPGQQPYVDAAIEAFGKNEQVKKVFWTIFVAMAGLVLARVLDPVTAQQVVGIITGMGG